MASMSTCKSYLREMVIGTLDKDENYLQVKSCLQQEKLENKYEGY